ncbi:MAG TPA: PAS domain S-box protein [Polyangiales bacterium]|nr:PAS domain S-box protein [Polyangiales bacterium]
MDRTPLIARLAEALADSDPERALDLALATLREHGLASADAESGEPWLDLEHSGRRVKLVAAEDGQPDDITRACIGNLLRLGVQRATEHEAARRARERMEMLSEASFEGIMIHVNGVVIDANQRVCEMLGYTHSEFLGDQTMYRCVAAEDLPLVAQRMADRAEGEYVITGVRKDGSRFRAEILSKQGKLGDRPIRVSAVRDVTERERTSALLRESETRLRHILEAAFDIVVTSKNGIIVDAGGQIEKYFGQRAQDVVGHAIVEYVAPEAREQVAKIMSEQRVGPYETFVTDVRGETIPVSVLGVKSTLNGEPVRVAALRDLREPRRLEAERRRLEQQVERAQRLDSLGVLAGGIAHDFNNLLVGVLGGAELLLRRLQAPADRAVAETIRMAGERASGLTKQMLTYAGRRDLNVREPVDIGALCHELRDLLDATLSKKARVELALEPGCVVLGDRATLMQVLMNLLTNASDALEDRTGTIQVSTQRVRDPDSRWQNALGGPIQPGTWVQLQVRDTGAGMDEATQRRIFEPFFSTKPLGHGLGLASCLGIVTSHRGAILVESERGRGSTFYVLLPAAERAEARRPERPATTLRPCRVLVVDDEPLVRTHLRRLLDLCGYGVEVAHDARSGLATLESYRPDVMLLDLTMPDLDGVEVVKRLRARGSRLPIVLCSGNLDYAEERGLEPDSIQGSLRKPFSTEELIEAIELARVRGHELPA